MTAVDTTRADWLAWRRDGIGGSDIAAILGLSPWASPWSVWADKAGLLPPEPDNEAMAAGRWLEAAIGPWFAHETGLVVAGEQTMVTHPAHPWARCTVDGFVGHTQRQIDLLNAEGVIEIKVTGPGRRWDGPPPHYVAQVQWQLACTGYDRAWLTVLMGRRLDIHEITRDDDDIAFMLARADDFWHDHVVTGTPPATDGHDATLRAIAAVHPGHVEGQAVEADDVLRRTIDYWRAAKAAEKDAAAEVALHAAAITAALGDAEELTVDGQRAVSWRAQSARRLDAKALTAAHPDIAAGFTRETTYRVLRNHAPKETR